MSHPSTTPAHPAVHLDAAAGVRSLPVREGVRSRRWFAAVPAALALVAMSVAPPASGAPLERIQNTIDDFSCVFSTEEGPSVYFFGSSSDGGSGSAAFVEGESYETLLEGWGGTATFANDLLSASVDLATVPDGVPAGALVVSAATTLGEPTVLQIDDRSGNTWTRGTMTTSDHTFSDVQITMPGFTPIVDATTCTGQRTIFDVQGNDPASRVYRSTSLDSDPCQLLGVPDAELRLSGQAREPYLEIVVGAQGDEPLKAQGGLERDGSAWRASLPLFALASGEQVDTLEVTAWISPAGAPDRARFSEGGFTEATWVAPHALSVQVVAGDGTRLTAECEAYGVRSHAIITPQFSGE